MKLTGFRNTHQLISPEMDLQSQAGVLGTLEEQQAQVMIDIDLLRDTVRNASDPRLKHAERRLAVIEERIRAEREKLGIGQGDQGDQAYADIVGEFERLMAERDFAERAYAATLANYDAAAAEARRKSRYLAAYMEPTLAESAEYPRRVVLFVMVAGTLFLLWAIGTLAGYSVRDRR
jgi:Capsule polysaccharide export protein